MSQISARWLWPILLGVALLFAPRLALAQPSPDSDDPAPHYQGQGNEPEVAVKPVADRVYLSNIKHDWQKWNNCGPTTTSMALSFFGINAPQLNVANVLKPNPNDVNVSPDQIVQYVRNQGLDAQVRVNGNRDTLMLLLSNDIPVIAEQWIEDYGGMGHYRLVTGYNRAGGTVTFDDSYYGPDRVWTWDEFEGHWLGYNTNRIYIPVYRRDQAAVVRAILGEDAADWQMWLRAEAGARANLAVFGDDARVWFALGDALLNQGRPEEAVDAYEQAYQLGLPWRYYWYQFGHFEALAKLGRWERLLELTQPVLESAPMHEEMYFYRGLAEQNLGNYDAAREDFRQAIANNRNFTRARAALQNLN